MLAVEVVNIQAGVWECRDGCWYESRPWRFGDVDDLGGTDQPVTIPTARGQTWQDHDSWSGLTQLVKSWESLACLQLCSGSPRG